MGSSYADTSFLVSLYGNDSHTSQALAYARTLRRPLTISQLTEFEFEQALQLAIFRQTIPPSLAARAEATLEADLRSGGAVKVSCDFSTILQLARRLSRVHTGKTGSRSFDILHVAAALDVGAKEFLTFDVQQGRLAQAEGLKVLP